MPPDIESLRYIRDNHDYIAELNARSWTTTIAESDDGPTGTWLGTSILNGDNQ